MYPSAGAPTGGARVVEVVSTAKTGPEETGKLVSGLSACVESVESVFGSVVKEVMKMYLLGVVRGVAGCTEDAILYRGVVL